MNNNEVSGTQPCRGESRDIPDGLRRRVRQECVFGCAHCGCPIIEYHHIQPFSEVRSHDFDNLVALCPTCHQRADAGGQWGVDLLREMKRHPHNQDTTRDRFLVSSADFIVHLGWFEFRNCTQLLALRDKVVLSCNRSIDGIIMVSGLFHDSTGNLVATIVDNEWCVLAEKAWDVEFIRAKTLIVRTAPREIVLRMKVTDKSLEIQQCFFRREDLELSLRGDDKNSQLDFRASNTFFRSKDERVIVQGPMNGPAITLR
ncbi:MAG: HNH endonuclease [Candidatus Aminicenantes bacterium]|nr:HNH endonuclease [Candidatus Aminicenantes bacterium]